jgi:ubiquinone/menaquinone biosynthesis C-methylase UbiE
MMIQHQSDSRLKNEIAHGKYLLERGAGEAWGWESYAGKERWARRVGMLSSHLREGMNVLEVGCGTGYFTKELVKTNARITAIDISPDLLEIAESSVKSKNVLFKVENAYSLNFGDNSFDSIIGSSVLHHLEIDRALREFYRTLKPGGWLYFTEPNMLNPQLILQKNIRLIKRKMGESPDETAFFRWKLRKKLGKYGFRNIDIRPFDFLHPQTPQRLIFLVKRTGSFLEKVPLLMEIAGSLYIKAEK